MRNTNSLTFTEKQGDGLALFIRHWPVQKAKAVLIIVHGLGEHSSRYEAYAEFMNRKAIACMAMDLPGHGYTTGQRGNFRSIDQIFKSVDCLLAIAKQQYPNIPAFLLGQSMGGNIVLNYALNYPSNITGVIAQSSWIRLQVEPSKNLLRFARIMKRIYPSFAQSNGLNPLDLATSPAVAQRYKADELVHDRISVAAGLAMLEAAQKLDSFAGEFPVPLLLMHGTSDRITDFQGTANLAERLTGDVQLELWDGYYHELHNEPIAKELMEKVAEWIGSRC